MYWQIFILIGYCGTRHNTPKLPPTYVYANYLQHFRIHSVTVVSIFVAFELCVKPAKHCFVEIAKLLWIIKGTMQSFEEEKVYLVYFSDTISRATINYDEQNTYICPCWCTAILPPCCQPVVQQQVKKKN